VRGPAGCGVSVVIVGYGMAGARLADEILRHDPTRAITIIGAERHPAYNRVLLSNVIAGSLRPEDVVLHGDDWAARRGVDLRTGVTVTGIDGRVSLSDGSTVDYDTLVLAAGSRPLIPPVPGLRPGEDVIPLRGLDDCRRILAAAKPGTRVAVLGGGLLGLEAASGLAGRGVPVTVVHPVGHLMERQLDPSAGAVLTGTLAAQGIDFRIGRSAVQYLPGNGLLLDDGSMVPADLVVVAAGARAETSLAEAARIEVDGGIVVDDQLRSSDPRVYAIGDCASHPGAQPGLVRPAWEQAAVLAKLLTGADPSARYRGTPVVVTRLKARGVDLASMGEAHTEPGAAGAEVLRLEDPVHGRYAKLVLRDNVVTGAIVLGVPDAAATITQLHDSGAPAPSDRIALLLGRAAPVSESLESPLICQCNTVHKGRIVDAWRSGARTVSDLAGATRASTGCGSCLDKLLALTRTLDQQESPVP
jgi:assimilatory nitrate reductase electron transfer subunit